jgi:hypothetical protein
MSLIIFMLWYFIFLKRPSHQRLYLPRCGVVQNKPWWGDATLDWNWFFKLSFYFLLAFELVKQCILNPHIRFFFGSQPILTLAGFKLLVVWIVYPSSNNGGRTTRFKRKLGKCFTFRFPMLHEISQYLDTIFRQTYVLHRLFQDSENYPCSTLL